MIWLFVAAIASTSARRWCGCGSLKDSKRRGDRQRGCEGTALENGRCDTGGRRVRDNDAEPLNGDEADM
jgi:hypothetical protein